MIKLEFGIAHGSLVPGELKPRTDGDVGKHPSIYPNWASKTHSDLQLSMN